MERRHTFDELANEAERLVGILEEHISRLELHAELDVAISRIELDEALGPVVSLSPTIPQDALRA